jgi:hypothetical protein
MAAAVVNLSCRAVFDFHFCEMLEIEAKGPAFLFGKLRGLLKRARERRQTQRAQKHL